MADFPPAANQLSGTGVPLGSLPRPVDIPDGVPVGSLIMWATGTAPTKYLLADGSAISREEFKELFALWGTTYGVGDGSTTFNLLNLTGKFPIGRDSGDASFDTLGETGGAKTHTLTEAQLPSHDHGLSVFGQNVTARGAGAGAIDFAAGGAQSVTINNFSTQTAGSGSSHPILPPYRVVNYIVRAKP